MTRQTAVRVARLSVILPLAAMASNAVMNHLGPEHPARTAYEQGQAEGRAFAIVLAYVAGAILGGAALRTVKQHGPEGIRLPAWIGLALNGILLLAMAAVLFMPAGQ